MLFCNDEGICALSQIIRLWFVVFMTGLAGFTILTYIGFILHFPYVVLVCAGAIVFVAPFAVTIYNIPRIITSIPFPRNACIVLCISSLLCLCLSLMCFGTASDDAIYLPNAVYYSEHPGEPFTTRLHYLANLGQPYSAPFFLSSTPWEYWWGSISVIFHIPFFKVVYFGAVAFGGVLVPAAWYLLLRKFQRDSFACALGVFAIICGLLMVNEVHRSFGDFFFTRIYEGKGFFFAIGIPLFIELSLDFLQTPSRKRWLSLAACSAAAVGLTTSSISMLPLLSITLLLAFSISVGNGRNWKRSVGYMLSLVFPFGIGLILYTDARRLFTQSFKIQNASGLSSSIRSTDLFLQAFRYVFNKPWSFTTVTVVLFSLLAIGVVKKRQKRFLTLWIVLSIGLYLNPVVAPYIMKYIAPHPVYWRLFYLLPFPLVIGIFVGELYHIIPNRSLLIRWAGIIPLVVWGLFYMYFDYPLIFKRRVFGIPRARISVSVMNELDKILPQAPPGAMFAPSEYSKWIGIVTSKFPQILGKGGLGKLARTHDEYEMARQRKLASIYLSGESGPPESKQAFERVTAIPVLKSVLVPRNLQYRSEVEKILSNNGFKRIFTGEKLLLFTRIPDSSCPHNNHRLQSVSVARIE